MKQVSAIMLLVQLLFAAGCAQTPQVDMTHGAEPSGTEVKPFLVELVRKMQPAVATVVCLDQDGGPVGLLSRPSRIVSTPSCTAPSARTRLQNLQARANRIVTVPLSFDAGKRLIVHVIHIVLLPTFSSWILA